MLRQFSVAPCRSPGTCLAPALSTPSARDQTFAAELRVRDSEEPLRGEKSKRIGQTAPDRGRGNETHSFGFDSQLETPHVVSCGGKGACGNFFSCSQLQFTPPRPARTGQAKPGIGLPPGPASPTPRFTNQAPVPGANNSHTGCFIVTPSYGQVFQ